MLAVGLGSLQLDQLASADHQLLEFGGFLRDLSDGPRLRLLGVAREDVGIDPIGLGEDPQTACEVTDLTRIGDCHLVPRVHQLSDHGSLIAPGGFHNDPTRPRRGQRLRQLCQALFVVGEALPTIVGKQAQIERPLGDIDTSEESNGTVHGVIPVLQMRARRRASALAAVRACSTRPATITLSDGLNGPRHDRSVASRWWKACFATLRSLSTNDLHYTLTV